MVVDVVLEEDWKEILACPLTTPRELECIRTQLERIETLANLIAGYLDEVGKHNEHTSGWQIDEFLQDGVRLWRWDDPYNYNYGKHHTTVPYEYLSSRAAQMRLKRQVAEKRAANAEKTKTEAARRKAERQALYEKLKEEFEGTNSSKEFENG
jgi:hypothetical protein